MLGTEIALGYSETIFWPFKMHLIIYNIISDAAQHMKLMIQMRPGFENNGSESMKVSNRFPYLLSLLGCFVDQMIFFNLACFTEILISQTIKVI